MCDNSCCKFHAGRITGIEREARQNRGGLTSTMKNVQAVILTLALVAGASATQTSPASDQSNSQQATDSSNANRADHRDWGLLGLLGLGGLLGLRRREHAGSLRNESGVRDNLRRVG